jgi:hypothetical protein
MSEPPGEGVRGDLDLRSAKADGAVGQFRLFAKGSAQDGPQAIPQSPQLRALGLRLTHDLHDLCVPRIGRAPSCADDQARLSIDSARNDRRTRGLRNLEGLTRQIRAAPSLGTWRRSITSNV